MSNDPIRPPIPMSLADRPVRGGLATPWVNVQLADGGTDFRDVHRTRYEQAWTRRLCQSCGNPLGDRAVLVCGPRQILSHRFDEPPVCPPCALYASRACPMVAGRVVTYPDRPRVVEGHRGGTCTGPGCECGGWRDTDPEHSANQGGQPALPWYGCWVRDADSPVTHTAWVIPRHVAEDLLRGFREELGPPRVESIGTVGGTVESYEQSQREGTALFWPGEDAT